MLNKHCYVLLSLYALCCCTSTMSAELRQVNYANQQASNVTQNARMYDYDDLVTCLDDESDELEKLNHAPEHWTTWIACKEGLKALYALILSKIRSLYYACSCTR